MTELVIPDGAPAQEQPARHLPTGVTTPKLMVPFQIAGGAARVVEQDSGAEIEQCVLAVLRTAPGSRADEPDLGLPDFTFDENGVDLSVLDAVLEEWEPRAALLSSQTFDGLVQTVRLENNNERRTEWQT